MNRTRNCFNMKMKATVVCFKTSVVAELIFFTKSQIIEKAVGGLLHSTSFCQCCIMFISIPIVLFGEKLSIYYAKQ